MVAPKSQPLLLSLVEELLAEQGRLQTPVVRAAIAHEQIANRKSEIADYQSLLPLTAPGPGEQYAFEVDLDACTGCKACVAACHALNGLDDTEAWRDVGALVGGTTAAPYQQTVTTACHHCADPACLNGCPVLAYEKDPRTGIVRHLDDQCIGCQYCILKCPYDVPKYNDRLGIVRKCDLCHQRLAAGEAPACAQACPTHAIRIVNVSTSPARDLSSPSLSPRNASPVHVPPFSAFLPSAPDPSYTQPTTRYVTGRPMPADVLPADAAALRPQPPHWPLVVMLVCTQAAVGLDVARTLVTHWVTNSAARAALVSVPAAASRAAPEILPGVPDSVQSDSDLLGWTAVVLAAIGLAASVAHLGQPLRAWRIFLGLRRSWLSREAVVFGLWLPTLAWSVVSDRMQTPIAAAALGLGLAGILCSAMIYIDTRRIAWRAAQTLPRFLGTAALFATLGWSATRPGWLPLAAFLAALAAKLAIEAHAAIPTQPAPPARRHTARLLTGRFRSGLMLRLLAAAGTATLVTYWVTSVGGGASPGGLVPAASGPVTAAGPFGNATLVLAAVLLLAGELAERGLWFRTVDAPKMPGQPAAGSAP